MCNIPVLNCFLLWTVRVLHEEHCLLTQKAVVIAGLWKQQVQLTVETTVLA